MWCDENVKLKTSYSPVFQVDAGLPLIQRLRDSRFRWLTTPALVSTIERLTVDFTTFFIYRAPLIGCATDPYLN